MNQYIITEEELLDTRSYIYHEDEEAFIKIERNVRSHPYQSERDKVLDEFVLITKHEYRLLEWVFGKLDEGRYSDALAEIITGVEQREELRQAGEP